MIVLEKKLQFIFLHIIWLVSILPFKFEFGNNWDRKFIEFDEGTEIKIYDMMTEAIRIGMEFQTIVDPSPGDRRVAHEE